MNASNPIVAPQSHPPGRLSLDSIDAGGEDRPCNRPQSIPRQSRLSRDQDPKWNEIESRLIHIQLQKILVESFGGDTGWRTTPVWHCYNCDSNSASRACSNCPKERLWWQAVAMPHSIRTRGALMKAAILALAIVACSALTTRAQVMGGYYGLPPGGAPGYGYGYIYQAWGYSPVPFGRTCL